MKQQKRTEDTGYTVTIRFIPGDGFQFSVAIPGESQTNPDTFKSLEGTAKYAAKLLKQIGYTVAVGD